MTKETPITWALPIRFSHGDATPIYYPTVAPEDKQPRERFWVQALLSRLDEMKAQQPIAETCDDDSNGNHDVIIQLRDLDSIGVQVTELTYEIGRSRKNQRDRFVAKVFECFKKQQLSSSRMLKVHCSVSLPEGDKYRLPSPEQIADATSTFMQSSHEQFVSIDRGRLFFQWVDKGALYGRSEAGIGFECDLDLIPQTPGQFFEIVNQIRKKKAKAKSPWLLIWSSTFWKAGRSFEGAVLQHLRASFADSHFERVYFIESMDSLPFFANSLRHHTIKQ